MKVFGTISLALAVAGLFCFAAGEPESVPVETETGKSIVPESTNSLSRAEVQQRLIEAWKRDEGKEIIGTPVEDLSFPLAFFEDGSTRVRFSAKGGVWPDDENEFIRANSIHIETYDNAGLGFFHADNCIYDREYQMGYCDGPVRLQYKNIKVFGTNLVWDISSTNATIIGGARTTLNGFIKNLGSVFR